MIKAVIFLGGTTPSLNLIKEEIKDAKLIIAADKGAEVLLKNNIFFHHLVGDLDSLSSKFLEEIKLKDIKVTKYKSEKDYTDGEIALNLAIDMGAKKITLLCATGTRLDHVLGNIALLYRGEEKGSKIMMKDDNNTVFLLHAGVNIIKPQKEKYFSLLPMEETKGLIIKNAKYEIKDYNLSFGETISLSNEFIGKDIEVNFESGTLVFCSSND